MLPLLVVLIDFYRWILAEVRVKQSREVFTWNEKGVVVPWRPIIWVGQVVIIRLDGCGGAWWSAGKQFTVGPNTDSNSCMEQQGT